MKKLLRSLFGSSPPAQRYARHPQVRAVGEALFPAEGSREPIVINEVGLFIWQLLEVPKSEEELVSAISRAFDVGASTARSDLRTFIAELLTNDCVITTGNAKGIEFAPVGSNPSEAALSAAYDRVRAKDWSSALALCVEARRDAPHPEIVELNVLICRYHLGTADVSEPALALAPELASGAQLACLGLAMASAYRAGDIEVTKLVACKLARLVSNPWDLPTIPTFVYLIGERCGVVEPSDATPCVEMIRAAQTRSVNSEDEANLLAVLHQRYREREAQA